MKAATLTAIGQPARPTRPTRAVQRPQRFRSPSIAMDVMASGGESSEDADEEQEEEEEGGRSGDDTYSAWAARRRQSKGLPRSKAAKRTVLATAAAHDGGGPAAARARERGKGTAGSPALLERTGQGAGVGAALGQAGLIKEESRGSHGRTGVLPSYAAGAAGAARARPAKSRKRPVAASCGEPYEAAYPAATAAAALGSATPAAAAAATSAPVSAAAEPGAHHTRLPTAVPATALASPFVPPPPPSSLRAVPAPMATDGSGAGSTLAMPDTAPPAPPPPPPLLHAPCLPASLVALAAGPQQLPSAALPGVGPGSASRSARDSLGAGFTPLPYLRGSGPWSLPELHDGDGLPSSLLRMGAGATRLGSQAPHVGSTSRLLDEVGAAAGRPCCALHRPTACMVGRRPRPHEPGSAIRLVAVCMRGASATSAP
jgi:hypothetical protein